MWHRLRKPVAAAVAIGVAVMVASAGIAVATTILTTEYTDAAGVFHACVHKENGNVRVVVPGTACRDTESAIEWHQRGPQGPAGPQGPKGDPGGGLGSLDALDGIACKVQGRDGTVVLIGGGFLGPAADAFTLWCLRPDEFEPNDQRASAADVTSRVSPGGAFSPGPTLGLTGLTLYPAGDEDWFVVHATAFRFIQAPPGVLLDVYRDGELVAQDLQLVPPGIGGVPPPGGSFANPVEGPHEWEFHVKRSSPRPAVYSLSVFG
jgi:hypothetical protein